MDFGDIVTGIISGIISGFITGYYFLRYNEFVESKKDLKNLINKTEFKLSQKGLLSNENLWVELNYSVLDIFDNMNNIGQDENIDKLSIHRELMCIKNLISIQKISYPEIAAYLDKWNKEINSMRFSLYNSIKYDIKFFCGWYRKS